MAEEHVRSFAVIVAGTDEEYQSSVLSGIMDAVKTEQVNASVFASFGGVLENPLCDIGEYNIYRLANFRKFDGAILLTNTIIDPMVRTQVIQDVQKAGIPAVVLDDSSIPDFHNIRIDNEKAMREVTEHVITVHGAKTINYISGPLENPEANSRYLAFLDVMASHGMKAAQDRIYFGDFRPASGKAAAEAFLRSGLPLPDAVICANDAMALEAVSVLKQNGIRVPEDVIVTGFDNTYYARYHNPSLTTVARPLYDVGQQAVRMLVRILNGEPCEKTVTMESHMVLQGSCGCVSDNDCDFRQYREDTYNLIKRNRTDVSLFNRMTSALAGTETTEDNVRTLTKFMQELGCEECSICLCDRWQSAFRGGENPEAVPVCGYIEEMSAPYVRTEYGTGSIESFQSEDMFPVEPDDPGSTSFFLPLHFRERCIGYYIITNGDFPIRSMLCHSFMLGISHSFENIRKLVHLNNAIRELDRLYVLDPLCGIYNRNGFIRLADQLFRQCQRTGDTLMISFIDMDGLKYVNDNYGHDEGDFALRQLAEVISECCGSTMTCARFGGDEFIAIGSGMTQDDAAHFEKTFFDTLRETNAIIAKPYRLDASIGSYLTAVEPDMKLFTLIAQADQAMYEQKKRKNISRYLRRD